MKRSGRRQKRRRPGELFRQIRPDSARQTTVQTGSWIRSGAAADSRVSWQWEAHWPRLIRLPRRNPPQPRHGPASGQVRWTQGLILSRALSNSNAPQHTSNHSASISPRSWCGKRIRNRSKYPTSRPGSASHTEPLTLFSSAYVAIRREAPPSRAAAQIHHFMS
jgi:hypothetical protein